MTPDEARHEQGAVIGSWPGGMSVGAGPEQQISDAVGGCRTAHGEP
ncbi:hypothetical protein [Amycolatopsis sp. CA-128772]|nr:hypothetical protein [Amycolatopsis sp. CA-128772]